MRKRSTTRPDRRFNPSSVGGSGVPTALQRLYWEHRIIVDEAGHTYGYAVPNESDTRTPRAQQSGRETSGFLVVHSDRNRARRRELSRGALLPLRGTNRPHRGKLTFENVLPIP